MMCKPVAKHFMCQHVGHQAAYQELAATAGPGSTTTKASASFMLAWMVWEPDISTLASSIHCTQVRAFALHMHVHILVLHKHAHNSALHMHVRMLALHMHVHLCA